MVESRLAHLELAFDRLEKRFQQRERWCEILNLWILQQFDYNVETYWLDLIAEGDDAVDGGGVGSGVKGRGQRSNPPEDGPLFENEGFYSTEIPISMDYEDSRDCQQVQDPLEYLQQAEDMEENENDSSDYFGVNKKYIVPCNTFVDSVNAEEEKEEGPSLDEEPEDGGGEGSASKSSVNDEAAEILTVIEECADAEENAPWAAAAAASALTLEHLLSTPPKQGPSPSTKDIEALMQRLEEAPRPQSKEQQRRQSNASHQTALKENQEPHAQTLFLDASAQSRNQSEQIQQLLAASSPNFQHYPLTFVPLAIALTSSPVVSAPNLNLNSNLPLQGQAQAQGQPEPEQSSLPSPQRRLSSEDSFQYPCIRCRKQFCSLDAVDAHMKTHRAKQREQIGHCEHCGKIYRTWKFFQKHCVNCTGYNNNDEASKSNSNNDGGGDQSTNKSQNSTKSPPFPTLNAELKKALKYKAARAGTGQAGPSPKRQNSNQSSKSPMAPITGAQSQKKSSKNSKGKKAGQIAELASRAYYEAEPDDLVSPVVFKKSAAAQDGSSSAGGGGENSNQPPSSALGTPANEADSDKTMVDGGSPTAPDSDPYRFSASSSSSSNNQSPLAQSQNLSQSQRSRKSKDDDEAVLVFNCKVCRLPFPTLQHCRQHIVATHLAQVLQTPVVGQSPPLSLPTSPTQQSLAIATAPIATTTATVTTASESAPKSKSGLFQAPSTPTFSNSIGNMQFNFPINSPTIQNQNQEQGQGQSQGQSQGQQFQTVQNALSSPFSVAISNLNSYSNSNNTALTTALAGLGNYASIANLANFVNLAKLTNFDLTSAIPHNLVHLATGQNPLNLNFGNPPISNFLGINNNQSQDLGSSLIQSHNNLSQFIYNSNQLNLASDLSDPKNQGQGLGQGHSSTGSIAPQLSNSNTNLALEKAVEVKTGSMSKRGSNSSGQQLVEHSRLKTLLTQCQGGRKSVDRAATPPKSSSSSMTLSMTLRSPSRSPSPLSPTNSNEAAPSPENMHPYICLHCKRLGVTQGFESGQEIHEHILRHHVTTVRFHCPFSFCQQVFLEQDAFEEHIVSDHQMQA